MSLNLTEITPANETQSSSPIIQVKNLKKSFGQTEILHDISFDVAKRQVCSIIGPSGSGKSTILRCLNQLELADSGHIQIGGIPLIETDAAGSVKHAQAATRRKIQLQMGLVFQSFNLFPHLNLIDNLIDAPIHVLKESKESATARALALLKRFDLGDKATAYPCELSGGGQQRAAIARALAMKPRILSFDEPTSALDPELTGEVLDVIRDLAKEDITLLIVTHEMSFARAISDHVIFIADGHIIEQGSAARIFEQSQNPRIQQFVQQLS